MPTEPTYRVVGVRADESRQVITSGLTHARAEAALRSLAPLAGLDPEFVRFEIEPEAPRANPDPPPA